MISKDIANVLCGTSLISVFIAIFFFTYASKVEQKIVQERCIEIVDDLTSPLSGIPLEYKNLIRKQINPYLTVSPSLEQEDQKVAQQNRALLKKTVTVVSVFLVVTFLIIFILSRIYGFSFIEILENNLLVLIFVALTEFVFLTFFAQNYITIDANFIKEKVAGTVAQFA